MIQPIHDVKSTLEVIWLSLTIINQFIEYYINYTQQQHVLPHYIIEAFPFTQH